MRRRALLLLAAALVVPGAAGAPAVAEEPTVERLAGPDRYATAATVAAHYWPHTAPVVHLATGRTFPDALSGAPAAARDDAPLLLVEPRCMPDDTVQQLHRLQPDAAGVRTVSGGNPSPLHGRRACAPTLRP